ncbi:MAG: tyrosine-protein kinase family protein [Betaproteobacteria bacterium]|nr:tyrosine-protein kinase family protein [Betaproteobacteria bacterium]
MSGETLIERAARRLEELRLSRPDGARGRSSPDESVAAHEARTAPRPADGYAGGPRRPAGTHSQLVELDLKRLATAGFITPDAPRSRVADEFRIIKRPLIANASGGGETPVQNGNLIMVTSAVPKEGKTFCAINLAMSIALEFDRSVLLVDADVAKPSLLQVLGLPLSEGLLDILQDKSRDLSQVLLRTNVEKLSLLTSGTPHRRATELLASDAMARLLEELASRYSDRIIIFDSPPLLVATEAPVLATQLGQIVLIVQAEITLQSEVRQALAAIESCPVKLIVLNQVGFSGKSASGFRYGYGYGYGYGEGGHGT